MYQPSGSRIVGGFTQAPATHHYYHHPSPPPHTTASSNYGRRPNNNVHMMPNPNVRAISLVSNPYLPPPPSYFSPHNMMNSAERSEPKLLTNWCVSVNNFEFDVGLIAELSGTLLANDGRTVIYENYYAGRLKLIISHNIVKTNIGVHHLVGQISQGYPNNLYRACLEANGIPKTWKYILTQFSGKPPAYSQPSTSKPSNSEIEIIGLGIQELIKSYRVLRHMATIADRRTREHNKAHKPISFVRHQFHEKLVQSLKTVNNQIILSLKTILKND